MQEILPLLLCLKAKVKDYLASGVTTVNNTIYVSNDDETGRALRDLEHLPI